MEIGNKQKVKKSIKNGVETIKKKIKKNKQHIQTHQDNDDPLEQSEQNNQEEDQVAEIDEEELVKINPENQHLLSDKAAEPIQSNSDLLSTKLFSELPVCEPTQMAIRRMKFQQMTHIQARSIPHLLKGRDVLGAAKTGSGKTLAFLIPAFELMFRAQFTQQNGTAIIVLSPTRELAQQTFDVCVELNHFHNKTMGLLIGGANRKQESIKLQKGVNVLIATPGRLLDHLQNTKFVFHNLLCLVIDEADQLLKIGYEEEMNRILEILPAKRQTVLFSATQTKKVDDLARLSLREPIYIGVDDIAEQATVDRLEQGYVIVPGEKRFLLLFTFLRLQANKKVMVFFSSCNSVKFHSDLLNYVDVHVMNIHGKQKQAKRTNTFYEFSNAKSGVLLCTDVAARGLDIPKVDWIVQYDPPDDTRDYIHRVGRTCRGLNGAGKALIFLLPEEKNYLQHLRAARVTMSEFEFPEEKLVNVQDQFDKLIEKNYYLNKSAFEAYKSYLHSYQSHSLKDCYDVNNLDLSKISRAFGFKTPPNVTLNLSLSDRTKRKQKLSKFQANARNKQHFLKKKNSDGRQFMR